MIHQLLSNWICWVIVLVALVCYQRLWAHYLLLRAGITPSVVASAKVKADMTFTQILISTLPLFGLLGTITGLLKCFAGIAVEGANGSVLSGGIADALLTTQLGLVCAVPGWLLQCYIQSCAKDNDVVTGSLR